MNSEQANELNIALVAAQGEFPIIDKSADNPFYKSKYAPYEQIYKGVKPILCKNGLMVSHIPSVKFSDIDATVIYRGEQDNTGVTQIISSAEVTVETVVTHAKSGQFKSVVMTAYPDKSNMHGVQAAVTYLKRNNLILLLDIAVGDEDDDGNGGVIPPEEQNNRRPAGNRPPLQQQRQQTSNIPPKQETSPQNMSDVPPGSLESQPGDLPFDKEKTGVTENARPATDKERQRVGLINAFQFDVAKDLLKQQTEAGKITQKKWLIWLKNEYKFSTLSEITADKFDTIMDVVEKTPEKIMEVEV